MTDKEANDIAEAMYDRDPMYEFERLHWLAYQREKEERENTTGVQSIFQVSGGTSARPKTLIECVVRMLVTLGIGVLLINLLLWVVVS